MEKAQKTGVNLELISKYRGQLMGLAIILIMFTHNSVVLPEFLEKIKLELRMLSQSGVDIFFFLSGLGCFYSLKSKSAGKFYRKRLVRILYPYLIVLVIYGLYRVGLRGDNFVEYITRFGLVSFFTKAELSVWFIAAILATYLFTPLFFKLLKNNEKLFLALIALIYLFTVFSRLFIWNYAFNIIDEIWFVRLPTYLFGMLIAKRIVEKKTSLSDKQICLTAIAAIVCMVLATIVFFIRIPSYWVIVRILFLPMVFGIVLFFGCLLEKTKGDFLKNILKWFGAITLEIYLIHEKVLSICTEMVRHFISNEVVESVISNILAIIIAVCLAKLLNLLVNKLLKTKLSLKIMGSSC